MQDAEGGRVEGRFREPYPTVLPYIPAAVVEKPVQLRAYLSRGIARGRPAHDVGQIVRFFYAEGKIDIGLAAAHRGLQLGFRACGRIVGREDKGSVILIPGREKGPERFRSGRRVRPFLRHHETYCGSSRHLSSLVLSSFHCSYFNHGNVNRGCGCGLIIHEGPALPFRRRRSPPEHPSLPKPHRVFLQN